MFSDGKSSFLLKAKVNLTKERSKTVRKGGGQPSVTLGLALSQVSFQWKNPDLLSGILISY